MTETLTEVFCDKWFDAEGTSSAIAAVYYSSEEKSLFVEFLNGTTAGYANVPADIYVAMETLNSNRVNGDKRASVGSYYNMYFRNTNYFEGRDTADIEIVTQEDRDRTASLKSLMANDVFADESDCAECAAEEPVEASQVFIAPLEQEYMFAVAFTSGENTNSLAVKATDVQSAVDKFQQAVSILGWDKVTIVSVTQYLNG